MSQSDTPAESDTDFSPAAPLEISGEQAQKIDAVLQRFAESAELETALVVHCSGGLVSGISSEAEVTVEVISALVASASGALQALVRELGEPGNLESFHLGDGRALYFKSVLTDFVLVGVSSAHVPVGLVREGARQVTRELESLLEEIPAPDPVPKIATARTYAVLTPANSPAPAPVDAASVEEPAMPEAEEEPVLAEEELPVVEDPVEEEPTEVIEMLGREDPEIVIDGMDSPFEAEEDDPEDELAEPLPAPADSIFEIEEDAEEAEEGEVEASELHHDSQGPDLPTPEAPVSSGSIFEIEEETEEEEFLTAPFELDLDDEVEEDLPESEAEGESFELAFELDEEEEADSSDVEAASEEDASEEEEVRSSGPFYF